MTPAPRVVADLWLAMAARDWDAAARLVHPEAVVEWPQSRERIRGRENFIALNRHYPGDWSVHVESVEAIGDGRALARVRLPSGERTEYCIGVYEVADGVVARATEFWAEAYPAPEWRRAWVEPL